MNAWIARFFLMFPSPDKQTLAAYRIFFVFAILFLILSPDFAAGSPVQTQRFSLNMAEDALTTRLEIPNRAAVEILPDKEGAELSVRSFVWDAATKTWQAGKSTSLVFWAKSTDARALESLKGIPPRSWRDRPLELLVRREINGMMHLWLEGQLLLSLPIPNGKESELKILPGKSVTLRAAGEVRENAHPLLLPVDLGHLTGNTDAPIVIEQGGISFEVRSPFSMREAGWPEWPDDPWLFYERYDAGPSFIGDTRIPMIQVPKADYLAVHVLASADEDPATGNHITLRAGRRIGGATNKSQVLFYDFMGEIPRGKGYQPVRIPFTEAFAQDVEGDVMDIEVTKELRLTRRAPDPNRFRWRPIGLPSGVRIAAITLEKSPIQFAMESQATGNLFEIPEPPAFTIRLTNITNQDQSFILDAGSGEVAIAPVHGTISPGETLVKEISLPIPAPGRHPLTVTLRDGAGQPLLVRNAFFGILPKDERKYRSESPLGTWDFGGPHFTSENFEVLGDLHRKLGLRYGMFEAPAETRAKYGVIRGNEFAVFGTSTTERDLANYAERIKRHPDTVPTVLIFHESTISGPHETRVPDLFTDRPPYDLTAEDKKRFQEMWDIAVEAAKAFRKEYPGIKLKFGNGPITVREQFYRHKFPKEFFDVAGNESGSFGRPPETQPPDMIANNACLWMDRQLLDAYGYEDKATAQCYEVIYPSSNPGNLNLETQASYFIRHILHSLAWNIPKIRPGGISDVGNSYRFSNWGSSGFFTSRPRIEPKPTALAIATLTRALDGAKYEGFMDTGSDSAYLLRFRRKDNSSVLVGWVVRGSRDFFLTFDKPVSRLNVIFRDGQTEPLTAKDGVFVVPATAAPLYVEIPAGVNPKKVELGSPIHANPPQGKVTSLADLTISENWELIRERNSELEFYNPMTPRRKGEFTFEPVAGFEGKTDVLRVTPQPISGGKPTMAMYAELSAKEEIPLPGEPAEIGLWINGNSSWGRIIFELEDAVGQRWTSIGAPSKEGSAETYGITPGAQNKPTEFADWNTDDSFGFSRINFDGWRYVGFPLPGQYPGEGYHWPANAFWKWTGDGKVHYPLRLKKLIVELLEKTLYLTRFEPAKRPEIYLRDLVTVERDINAPKTTPAEYVESAQIDMQ